MERRESTPIRGDEQEEDARSGGSRYTVCTMFAGGDSHGEVRGEGVREGRAGDARTKARDVEVGPLRAKGHEPQTGHRHRLERSATGRREGAQEDNWPQTQPHTYERQSLIPPPGRRDWDARAPEPPESAGSCGWSVNPGPLRCAPPRPCTGPRSHRSPFPCPRSTPIPAASGSCARPRRGWASAGP